MLSFAFIPFSLANQIERTIPLGKEATIQSFIIYIRRLQFKLRMLTEVSKHG